MTYPTVSPALSTGPMTDLMMAVEEIRREAVHYRLAEAYYRGRVGEVFADPAIGNALRAKQPVFSLDLAGRAVDALLDRIEVISVAAAGGDGESNEALTEALRTQVWDANRMQRRSKSVTRGALMYGDAYLIVWPGDDGEDDDQPNTVQLRYNSPISCRVFYDEEDPDAKRYAAKMWCEGPHDKAVTRVNLYYADRVERYATAPGIAGDRDDDFTEYAEEGEPWPIANPYGQVPVFHFRNDDPYGTPEHRRAFGPQNALTKLVSTQMDSIDYAAFPQRYALQAGPDTAQPGYNQVFGDDESENPNDRESSLRASPGSLWKLAANISKVGQFETADPRAFLDPAAFFIRGMAAATGTPVRFFDPAGEVPSGEALRADEAPLASKVLDREEWLTETWNDSLVFACQIVGLPVEQVDMQWAPVQIVSDKAGWETAEIKIRTGVPRDVVMTEAGYLPGVVEEWPAPEPTGRQDENQNEEGSR